MTVNNLNSAVFASRAFLNAASWGMKMKHTDYFLEILLEYLSPEPVLVVTDPVDFERDYRERDFVDGIALRRFFDEGSLFRAHLRHLSVDYLVKTFPETLRDRVGRKTYYSLDFDEGGSVPLDLNREGFERRAERWNASVADAEHVDVRNYESLRAMARRCREQGIRLVVVQAPIREAVLGRRDRCHLEEVDWRALRTICEEEGARFLNFHGRLVVSEADFADSTHLNRQGATKLSEAIVQVLGEPPATAIGLSGEGR